VARHFELKRLDTGLLYRAVGLGCSMRISFDELQAQIAERDGRDMERKYSSRTQAPDAHVLDTTNLSVAEAVAAAAPIVGKARA
jgi:CMP/dCMP kinase